jgi:hypothetical protein
MVSRLCGAQSGLEETIFPAPFSTTDGEGKPKKPRVYAGQSKPRRVASSLNADARMAAAEEGLGRFSKLVLRGLAKHYGPVNALQPMDLGVASGSS